MIVCDANLLLYAYNSVIKEHTVAVNWLETILSGSETVGFCWPVISAFLRISTSSQAFVNPLTMEQAVSDVNEWLGRPNSAVLAPTTEHWMIFTRMLEEGNVRGRTTTDAEIAAYTIEHGAVLHTADRDFRRFSSLQIMNPLGS